MRILVVGPYPPRRCGIGAYARDQVERLRAEGHHVSVLTAPDGDGDLHASLLGGRAFLAAVRAGGRFDRILVHFQPALYFRPRAPVSKVATSAALLALTAVRGRSVEVLVHEADPPKRRRPDYVLLRLALARAGSLSFHTSAERERFEAGYGVHPGARVVPHVVEPRERTSRADARTRLGLPADRGPVFVCAGFLHPDKGFDRAVRAFTGRGSDRGRLYVVGSVREPTPENLAYAATLAAACRGAEGVEMVERFLPDDEFDRWVAAADWVVLPYRRSWSSGLLARAHALGTPAIVSAVGGLAEQAGEHDVVVRDDDELDRAFRDAAAPVPGGGAGAIGGEPRRHRHGGGAGPETDWDPELEAITRTRKERVVLIGLILVSVALAAAAQLTLKHGMNQVTQHGEIPLSLSRPVDLIQRVAVNISVWAGLGTFVLSAAVWLIVLSRASLSFAYPFASLTYVLILVFDRFVLNEPISGLRYVGVALIIAGLLLISRTHQTG